MKHRKQTQYLLDFDRVIFDVESYLCDVEREGLNTLRIDPEIWEILDPRTYLYEDALEFLKSSDSQSVSIVSAVEGGLDSRSGEYQRQKIARANIAPLVSAVHLVSGRKGEYIQKLFNGTRTVFVDDKLSQLMSVQEWCPEIQLVQMLRPTAQSAWQRETDSNIPVITSFKELPALIDSNE